ncbi:hypothetical protein W02_42010 [Nitrospira sp. KM1]|nr:hypothetical protein W02_42010 [Nitrospira sp. KM1]
MILDTGDFHPHRGVIDVHLAEFPDEFSFDHFAGGTQAEKVLDAASQYPSQTKRDRGSRKIVIALNCADRLPSDLG